MGPRSGYDLQRWMDVEGRFLRSSVHHSQIYRSLAGMVGKEWIAFETDLRHGRPAAKVYRLTETGREQLLAWARSPYNPSSRFQDRDFIVRLMFSSAVDAEAALSVVKSELACRRDQVATNRGRNRQLAFDNPIPEVDPVRTQEIFDLAHEQGAEAIDRWISWLQRVQELLEVRVGTTVSAVQP